MPGPSPSTVPDVTAETAVGWRVAAHGLDRRRSARAPLAAPRVALPDYPAGAALRSLAARRQGVRDDTVRRALARGTLVRAPSLRGTTHVFPAADAAVWTAGVLPTPGDETAAQAALGSAWPVFEALGVPAVAALDEVAAALARVAADGQPRTRGALSEALHDRLADGWEPWCERCGAHHVPDLLFRVAAVATGLRFAADGPELVAGPPPGRGTRAHADARAELVRRFLGAYAPAPARAFAEWCGLGPAEATASFAAVGDEVVEVRLPGVAGARARADDVADLVSGPPRITGVRLVPAGDPFLQQRDRATLVPDADRRRRVWRPAGSPGLVLVDGRPAGVWRHKQGKGAIEVTVELWDGPVAGLRDEAAAVLASGDTDAVRVDVGDG